MYQINILGLDDYLKKGMYCRPLQFTCGDFGGMDYVETSTHGLPLNNFKWAPIGSALGEYWLKGDKKVKDFNRYDEWEFAEGDIPKEHILDILDIGK